MVAPRHALAQGPRAEPAGGLGEGLPPHAGEVLHAEQPVEPGPEGVAVDEQRRRSRRVPLGERARQRRGSRATGPADHPDQTAGRGPLADVGELVGEPALARRAGRPRCRAQLDGVAEDGVADTGPTTWTPVRLGGAQADDLVGRSSPTSTRSALAPRGQGERRARHDLGPDPRRRTEGDDVESWSGRGPGDQEDGHAPSVGAAPTPVSPRRGPVDNDVPAPPVDAWRPAAAGARTGPPSTPLHGRMPRPNAAFFDLDKTIIAKSSTLGLQPRVPGGRADLAARDAALGVRPVRLPRRRRRPRPDGEDARSSCRSSAPAGTSQTVARHRRRDPAPHRRPARLRRGRDPDRGAPRGRSRHRHRVDVAAPRWSSRSARCSAPTG